MSDGSPVARSAGAIFAVVALACLGGLLSPWLARSLAGRGGVVAWVIDLAAHWQWLFLALMVAAIVPAVALGGRRWALLLLAAPLPWLSASPPLTSSPARAAVDGSFTVASANVYYRNHDPARLRAWLDEVRPDVVVIVEISHRFARAIDTAAWQDYPHRHVAPAADAFGVAVLSRHPLEAATVWRDLEGVGVLLARVAWRNRMVPLAAFHPVTPQSVHHHRERNRVLDCLTPSVPTALGGQGPGDAALVAGDFNATPWSDAFVGPSRRGWRRATGLAPTWPVAWRGLMGIPIDHVLASDGWQLIETGVGPAIGSDHRPVMARLQAVRTKAVARVESTARPPRDPFGAVTSCLSTEPANARSGA